MKTGAKIAIGVAAVAAVGGIGYYLWKKGKQVAGNDQGYDYGTESMRAPAHRTSNPTYSAPGSGIAARFDSAAMAQAQAQAANAALIS